MTLRIIGIPKPFEGPFKRIQSNAIRSWSVLPTSKEITLLAEPSAVEIAREVGADCIPEVPVDRYGTPLFGPCIAAVARDADDLLCYVNSDIILDPGFAETVSRVSDRFDQFLLVGRRWNLDHDTEIDFAEDWFERLKSQVQENGRLFAPQAIDLFCFTPNLYPHIPPFAIGRSYWDNWMIYAARASGAPVLDMTNCTMLIHQNHSYSGYRDLAEIRNSFQGKRNFYLAGDSFRVLATTEDASYVIDSNGGIRESARSLVSVVIPFAGRQQELRSLLHALTHQTYPRTWIEILVVVNGAEIDLGSLKSDFSQVLFTLELKKSAAVARNRGIALASGDIIALIDSDCLPEKNWIAEGVAALGSIGEMRFVAGAIEQVVRRGGKRSVAGAIGSVLFLQQERYVKEHGTCVTANMFSHRQTFDDVGGFHEDFAAAAGEDWEWCKRATEAGYQVKYAEQCLIRHPTLVHRRDLANKLDRILYGNLTMMRLRGQNSEITPPGLGWLLKRSRKLLKDSRLSTTESILGVLMLASLLPRMRRRWFAGVHRDSSS